MATYLNLVNDVLIRLREAEVTATTDTTYSKLISKFVNDAKREVEDAWNWTTLRTEVTLTLTASDSTYALDDTTHRTRILEVHNTTDDHIIQPLNHIQFQRRTNLGSSVNGSPLYYKLMGFNSSTLKVKVEFHPIPDTTDTIEFYCVVPQADLSSDATVLSCPAEPVILGAYAKAVSERGEDGGQLFTEADKAYRDALHNAIAWDGASIHEEMSWIPV